MYAIGEFARIARVTIKTLRFYDEAGLLKPARVDAASGYRYYRASQLPRLKRILVLKELGFTLEQLAGMLEEGVAATEMQGMLRLRQAEQQTRVQEEQNRLALIEQMIAEIAREGAPLDVVVQQTMPRWVVSVRDVIGSYGEIGRLYPEVYAQLGPKAATATPIAIWYCPAEQLGEIDAEAGVLVDGPMEVGGRLRCYQMEAALVASHTHHGSIEEFSDVYSRLTRWIEDSGWQPNGPCREVYLHIGNPVRQDDPSYVTEIQFPVERVA